MSSSIACLPTVHVRHSSAGSKGKTTTSWLVRGIFEEMQLVTGLVGTLEYSLAVDKMTEDGDLWKPDEEDITLERCLECIPSFFPLLRLTTFRLIPATKTALNWVSEEDISEEHTYLQDRLADSEVSYLWYCN